MTLQRDMFYEQAEAVLVPAGWVLNEISRYDPTSIVGVTPSGKAFTFTLAGNTVTLTIAGNTRTRTVAKTTWEPGDATVAALNTSRNAFPANQR